MMRLMASSVRGLSKLEAPGMLCELQALGRMPSLSQKLMACTQPLGSGLFVVKPAWSRYLILRVRMRGFVLRPCPGHSTSSRLEASRNVSATNLASQSFTSGSPDVICDSATSNDVPRPSSVRLADEKLIRAIMFEASKGFLNAMGKNTRFGEFLYSQLSALVSANDTSLGLEVRKTLQAHAESSKSYEHLSPPGRSSLLDGVVQVLGFRGVQDMVAFQEANQDLQVPSGHADEQGNVGSSTGSGEGTAGIHKCSSSSPKISAHPAVIFGSSDPVDLYDLANLGDEKALDELPKQIEVIPKRRTSTAGSRTRVRAVDLVIRHEKKARGKLKAGTTSTWDEGVLTTPISEVEALSKNLQSRLASNGIFTVRTLLHHLPRTYVNFQQAEGVIEDGQHLSFTGTILSSRCTSLGPSLGMIEIVVKSVYERLKDSIGPDEWQGTDDYEPTIVYLHLKRFFKGHKYTNPGFLHTVMLTYTKHPLVTVSGKVKAMALQNHFEIREFSFDPSSSPSISKPVAGTPGVSGPEVSKKPYPVYPAKGVLKPKTIELCIQKVLQNLPLEFDPVPKEVRRKFKLLDLRQAYLDIHNPASVKEAEQARQRLVFDEFFYLQLGMLLRRQQIANDCLAASGLAGTNVSAGSLDQENWSPLTLKLVKSLPYSLTPSQQKAASEIMWDLQKPVPMSRLLQGDVGCGKTIIAFLALLEVIDAGYQGALMAPTEFLASQHHKGVLSWLDGLEESERPRVALLMGSTLTSKARAIRSGLESGDINLIIGTHSLISESVKFASLGLAVIDEQHRFGVDQRGRLHSKGSALAGSTQSGGDDSSGRRMKMPSLSAPHVLAMSATPIPRTLALAMHGDMALSQITELPAGRPEISTHVFLGDKEGRQQAYEIVHEELQRGGRAFFVFPVIELSEELPDIRAAVPEFKNLEREFESFKCGLVHGRMKSQEKEEAMRLFKTGETQLLVSTTVIEVGIDIPEASVMVIEHAERYGMAQLHQLRGRVGRGTRKSMCILFGSTPSSLSRLRLVEKSRDGFYLAEMDLKSRGPGDVLGKRQSGNLPEFSVARIETDGEMLLHARTAAEEVLQAHPGLEGLIALRRELSMRRAPGVLD